MLNLRNQIEQLALQFVISLS